MLRKIITSLIPKKLRTIIRDSIVEKSKFVNHDVFKTYAQFQEDLYIASFFDYKKTGSYIDIGAYDPAELSNTKKFYDLGWRGINVDASLSTIEKFKIQRPDDNNLHCGISDKPEVLTFYEFNFGGLSTFNQEDAIHSADNHPGAKILSQTAVKCNTLESIFQLAKNEVDFLSIDVEGYEDVVLRSNDWTKHRPKLIIIEINRNTESLMAFMKSIGYKKVYNNQDNGIFIDDTLRK